MTGYTKLFGSIITSTIWREKKETKILWVTMLALKNKHGIVEGSVPGLADMARLTIEETREALETLRSPDPDSRTKEHEGRRIEDVDGGWFIINHDKWRRKMNQDERREYLRVKQAEHRAKVSTSVNKRKQKSTKSTHTYTDADTDTKKEEGAKGSYSAKATQEYSRPAPPEFDLGKWLLQLSADPVYKGINITTEYGKMLNWCQVHRKQPTQRRFVNWINHADRTLPAQRPTKPDYKRNYLPPAREPTEAELAAAREIAHREKEKLREQLRT